MEEENYKKELAENGVDLPELKETETEEAPTEEKKTEEQPTEPLQETKEPRKRSIYDEYKEKKSELKTERELREAAEQERDELRAKYEAVANATTPQERVEAQDELEQFAAEIGADPQAIKRMRALFLKDVQPTVDPELAKDLQEFKAWKAQNSQVLEKQLFDQEFSKVTPSIKEMFPSVSDEELNTIKAKLDEVAHSKDYHDKDLDYVVFKHRDVLSALVSPKKRGMEPRGNKESAQDESFDFDPSADYSKMSLKQREQWEAAYKKMTQNDQLMTDADGRKLML